MSHSFDMKVLLEITAYSLQCLSWRLDGLVAGLSGAVLLKMLHLLHSDTGRHLTMSLGKLQGSGTNMTIKFYGKTHLLKYLPSISLLFLKNSHTQFLLFLDLGFWSSFISVDIPWPIDQILVWA